jgi:tetratricopeptide (TPR) repeat protein
VLSFRHFNRVRAFGVLGCMLVAAPARAAWPVPALPSGAPAAPPPAAPPPGPAPTGTPPSPGEGFVSETDARVAVAVALGERLFKLGRYDESVAEYRRAYELRADPLFLYNIAECYRELGAAERALFYYERFLAAKPDAPERDEVLDKITELEGTHRRARASHPRLVVTPEETTPKPVPSVGPWRKWWFWTAVGAVLAAGVTAAVLTGRSEAASPSSDLGGMRFY